jgi:hypothetical protein
MPDPKINLDLSGYKEKPNSSKINLDLSGYKEDSVKKKAKDTVESAPTSQPSKLGGMTDLSGIASPKLSTPSVLTPKGEEGYFQEQQVKKEKATQLSNKLNEYKTAYSNNRNISELKKVNESKVASDKVSLESAIQPHKDQNGVVNFGKYNYNKLLQGTGSAINGLVDFGLQVAKNTPATMGIVSEGTILDYRNNIAPKVREGLKEYIGADLDKGQERKFDEGFISGAVGGVLYSLPAMLTPYGIGLYSQAYDSGLESINRTEAGQNLTETQKTLYAGSVGAVMGRLEKLGLDKIMGGAGAKVANTILLDAFESLTKKGVKKITQELLETEISQITKSLSKKLLRGAEGAVDAISSGAKIEGTTGGLQELGTVGLERLTNYLTNEKVFDEESMGELAGRVLKSAGQEAIGGMLMGGAIGGVKGFNEGVNTELVKRISNATTFDEQRNVLLDIEQIAQEQGMDEQSISELVNRTNELVEINKTLPKELSAEERIAVIPIVEERNAIQEEIDKNKEEIKGVDEAFKKEEQVKIDLLEERKNKLNEFIADPTSQQEQEENAIQEPSTEIQVSPVGEAGQVIPEGSEGVGQSKQGKEVTEEVKPTEEVVTEAPKKQGISREVTDLDIAKSNLKFAEIAKNEATEYLNRYKNNPFADKVSFNKAKLADANKKIKKLNQDISKLSEVKPTEDETKPILYTYNGEKVISEEDLVTKQGTKYKRLTFDNGKNLLIKEKEYAALEKQKELSTQAPQQTVEQLRAQEQAEYAAMANPEDEVERQKIYDKYDKLITPLIRAEAKQESVVEAPKELTDAQNKLKRAKSEASKNRLIQDVQKLSTPDQFNQFIKDNPEFAKNLPKEEQQGQVEAPPIAEDLEIEGEVETPSEAKKKDIEKRRQELLRKLRVKGAQAMSGFNLDMIPDLIKLGATYIEDGIVNFKEFYDKLKNDYGSDIPEDNARDIFKKSAESLGKGIRKLPTRIAADEGLSPELRGIANEADAVYQRQNYDDIQETLDNMSEADKNGIVGALENATGELSQEGNIGVLAAIDLINKYEAAGDKANATRVFDIVSKSSTVFAQLLRQYGQLKSSTVQGFLSLIEKNMLKKYDVQLTDAQKSDIESLYDVFKDKTAKAKEALDNHIKDLTNKTKKDLSVANIELEDAGRLLNDYLDSLKPKTWKGISDKMIAITQGNLLTIKSLIVNPLANAIQYAYKLSSNEIANLKDLVISIIASKPRTRISGFSLDAMRLSGKGAIEGFKAANRSLLKGASATEISKYDVSGRLKPVEAWRSLWKTLSGKQQFTLPGVLTDLLEATAGATANLALRLLPYGDLPRNQMAKVYKLVEIGVTKFKLKGKDLDRFILNPDAESLAIAEDYGDRATLQNKTKLYDLINQAISQFDTQSSTKAVGTLKGLGKFIVRGLVVPFLKTPINAAVVAFRLSNPIIPMAQAGVEMMSLLEHKKIKNIDLRNEKLKEARHKITGYLGEAVVAQIVLAGAVMLVKYGLTTGGVPDKDEKEKNFMFQTFGPNQLNISGLKRLLSGGDPTMQQGDVSISYLPLGLFGAQVGVVTEGYKAREKESKQQQKFITAEGKPFYSEAWDANQELGNGVVENLPASLTYMLDQGFVQGTSAILQAVSNNDYNRWSSQWVKTFVTGIGAPNTVVQGLRASNEYMTNTFDEDQVKNIANTVKNLYGETEGLPVRYDMWGKKILQTPKGENPYVYHVLDIFRSQQLLLDKNTYNVFLLYKKTGDKSAIPSGISEIIEESRSEFKIKLTPLQKADLQRIVGEERLRRIKDREQFDINNNDPEYLEKIVKGYSRAYSNGLSAGKRRFKKEVLDKIKKQK